MSTITESFPFCYAFKNSSKIRVHILVNVPAGKKIIFPAAGVLSGQSKVFKMEIDDDASSTASVYHFKNYEFDIIEKGENDEKPETIDTVEIYTKFKDSGTNRIKTMKIEVGDMDVESGTWPALNQNLLLDAPYVCTRLIEIVESGINKIKGFEVEIYLKCTSKSTFTDAPSKAGDAAQNTEYLITSTPNSAGTFEHVVSPPYKFGIDDVHLTTGANSVNHNGGRKGKTKNKNHTVTPFPSFLVKRHN